MWHKITPTNTVNHLNRRTKACASRSLRRPDSAYIILPPDMAAGDRVSIHFDGTSRVGVEFCEAGEYAVRRTSARSFTRRINLPRQLAEIVPFGLTEIEPGITEAGWLVFDFQATA